MVKVSKLGDGLYLRPYTPNFSSEKMGDGLYLQKDGVFTQTGGLLLPNIFAALEDILAGKRKLIKSLEGNSLIGLLKYMLGIS